MKILIVDDHVLIRKGVRLLVEKMPHIRELYEADNGTEAIIQAQKHRPDIVIMDLSMPDGLDGFTAASNILSAIPETKIIVLTMHDEEAYIKKALQHQIHGYLLKNSETNELEKAIHTVIKGKLFYQTTMSHEQLITLKESDQMSVLTQREKEVLRLVALGYTNIQIGKQLFISTKTVERHKSNMLHKLGLNKSHELIQYGIKNHYVDLI